MIGFNLSDMISNDIFLLFITFGIFGALIILITTTTIIYKKLIGVYKLNRLNKQEERGL